MGFQWFSLIFIDFPWNSLMFIVCHWIFIDFQWFSMDVQWFSIIFIDFHWGLIDFHWFSMVFQRKLCQCWTALGGLRPLGGGCSCLITAVSRGASSKNRTSVPTRSAPIGGHRRPSTACGWEFRIDAINTITTKLMEEPRTQLTQLMQFMQLMLLMFLV